SRLARDPFPTRRSSDLDRGGAVRVGERAAESAVPVSLAGGAGVGVLLLVHEALHALCAPGAWARARDCAGGRISRRDGHVEPARSEEHTSELQSRENLV